MNDMPHAKKSLGQHWLTDELSLEAMCLAADVRPDDTVLEIGPGTGTLTAVLLAKGTNVTTVERDQDLAKSLPYRTQQLLEVEPLKNGNGGIIDNLQVVEGDILAFDFTELPSEYKVVANIPYYLTGNLIRVLSETPNPPTAAVLLVQKEVAQRVAAKPGAMSTLSVTAQFYWQVSLADEVPAELFTPPPKVDSQILVLKRRPEPLFPKADTKTFFRLVKAGFGARRKKLRSSLAGGLHISKEQAEQLLDGASIDPNLRAQALSLDDWHRLYQVFARPSAL